MVFNEKKILITGSNGFLGKNLLLWLGESHFKNVSKFNREDDIGKLPKLVKENDVLIHLAGVNRSKKIEDFETVNVGLTELICKTVRSLDINKVKTMKLIYISSSQYNLNNPYGLSKKAGEILIEKLAKERSLSTTVFRLPGVFGKWAKPNYNSVVATFCNNIAHNLSIEIHDPKKVLNLVYIDNVMESLINEISNINGVLKYGKITPEYQISLQELANKIRSFAQIKNTMIIPNVGFGIDRALYSTYLSYLPLSKFKYKITSHKDDRGTFVEVLKTKNNGQVSFFTANIGITRGGHYHHSKNEKFLVVSGKALFRFRNLITNKTIEFTLSDDNMEIVDTVPGWAHDITNIGKEKLIVMLWANEIFNKQKPDTFNSEL